MNDLTTVSRRNIKVLLTVTLTLGLMQGMMDLMFPFYLSYRGITLVGMGVLYTLTYCDDGFIQIFVGDYADSIGWKKMFSISYIVGGIANVLFTFGRGVIDLTLIKDFNDSASSIRTAGSSVMVFKDAGKAFTRIIAWFRGGGLVIQAVGYSIAVIILNYFGFFGIFYTIALVNFIAFVFFIIYYKETFVKNEGQPRISLVKRIKQAYTFNISRDLMILSIIGGTFSIGNMLSHTFSLPLYFAGKYGLDDTTIAIILSLHRFSMFPMLFVGPVIKKMGVKRIYPIALTIYATSFLLSGLIHNLWIMVPIWLTHDLIGGSLRMPSYETLTQAFAREENRGKDTGQSYFITEIVSIVAPVLAGSLAALNWDYLFLGGAAFIYIAVIAYLFFMKRVPEI